MAYRVTHQITSIAGGISETLYNAPLGTYQMALGVDPDLGVNSSESGIAVRTSGAIIPVTYTKFSGTEMTGDPMWIVTQPKTANSYVYAADGKLHSFDSSLVMRATDEAGTAFPITITGGTGNGAVYYNNFLYLAESTNITQYGGLDQGASIAKTENVWTGAKFGLTALSADVSYPLIVGTASSGTRIPNHSMHLHTDNSVYICDVLPSTAGAALAGRGCLHRMITSRTTIDGDTNNGSAYNVLDLPYGFYPTDIESYGTDIVVSAVQTINNLVNQGRSELFFWDTFADSFYNRVSVPDPLITALYNNNGTLYVFSGNSMRGARVSAYSGGKTLDEIAFFEDGVAPFAGAIDAYGERISFGGFTTYPSTASSVFSIGTKMPTASRALHNTARSTSTGVGPFMTSLRYVQQESSIYPRLVLGWGDDSSNGLDKLSPSSTGTSIFRTRLEPIGRKFVIKRVDIPLTAAVDSTTIITVKIFVDDGSTSYTLPVINNTNFSGKRYATIKEPEIAMNPAFNNYFLEFAWTGTGIFGISFPISVEVEIQEDQPR